MRIYRFYKDENGWFIDLKWFPFNKAWLAMVAGADELLDILAKGKKEVHLQIGTKVFDGCQDMLGREAKLGLFKGAVYSPSVNMIKHELIKKNQLWLCPATLWVFGYYPDTIYFRPIGVVTEEESKNDKLLGNAVLSDTMIIQDGFTCRFKDGKIQINRMFKEPPTTEIKQWFEKRDKEKVEELTEQFKLFLKKNGKVIKKDLRRYKGGLQE